MPAAVNAMVSQIASGLFSLSALPAEWRDWRADAAYWTRHNLVKLLVVVVLAFLLIQILKMATRRLGRFSEQHLPHGMRAQQLRTLATVIDSVGIVVILFLALMQALPMFGIDMKPLLASAGIAGLAIGFGAQTLVKDVINGFFILVENQYDIGDTVRLGPVSGTVEEMTLRRTVLRDVNGSVHVVPNSEIKIVTNMTRDWTQVSLHVPAAYNEPSEKVIGVLREAAEELRNDPEFAADIVSAPEVPGIERVGAGEVDYLLQVKTQPGAQHRVSRELRRRVKECFERNHIQVPGPARMYVAEAGRGEAEEVK
jgi:small conductance mechanosensitive channel